MGEGRQLARVIVVFAWALLWIASAPSVWAEGVGEADADALNKQAVELYRQGKYAEAEPLYKRSLAIYEEALGPGHPEVGTALNNLALLYERQGRYVDAEPLFNRSLALREKALGPDHPEVGQSLNNWPSSTWTRAATPRPSRSTSAT